MMEKVHGVRTAAVAAAAADGVDDEGDVSGGDSRCRRRWCESWVRTWTWRGAAVAVRFDSKNVTTAARPG